MAENASRKYRRVIDYVEDEVGVDIPNDVKRSAIAQVDIDPGDELPINLTEIGGTAQSAANLLAILASEGGDEVRVVSPNPLDASAAEIDVDLNTQSLSELAVEQQTPVGIEDTTDTQINPDQSPDYPATVAQQDLIGTGDLTIGPVSVARAEAVLVAANSEDGNTFSVSVDWVDGSGNVIQTQSASDLALASITEDWARVVRKAPEVELTFTDTSGGTANNINAFVDVHR